jgi:hypothetical protein
LKQVNAAVRIRSEKCGFISVSIVRIIVLQLLDDSCPKLLPKTSD